MSHQNCASGTPNQTEVLLSAVSYVWYCLQNKSTFLFLFILLHLVLISNSEVLLQAGNEEVRPCVNTTHLTERLFLNMKCIFPTLSSLDAQAVL